MTARIQHNIEETLYNPLSYNGKTIINKISMPKYALYEVSCYEKYALTDLEHTSILSNNTMSTSLVVSVIMILKSHCNSFIKSAFLIQHTVSCQMKQ